MYSAHKPEARLQTAHETGNTKSVRKFYKILLLLHFLCEVLRLLFFNFLYFDVFFSHNLSFQALKNIIDTQDFKNTYQFHTTIVLLFLNEVFQPQINTLHYSNFCIIFIDFQNTFLLNIYYIQIFVIIIIKYPVSFSTHFQML